MKGFLLFQGCGHTAQAAQRSAWPEFLQLLSSTSHLLLRCTRQAASGDHFPWPDTVSEPENTSNIYPSTISVPYPHVYIYTLLSHLCTQDQITHALCR